MTFSVQVHPTCLDHESCVIRKAKIATHSREMSSNKSWKMERHNLSFQSAVCPLLIETVVGTDQREDLHPFDCCALADAAQLLTSPTTHRSIFSPLKRSIERVDPEFSTNQLSCSSGQDIRFLLHPGKPGPPGGQSPESSTKCVNHRNTSDAGVWKNRLESKIRPVDQSFLFQPRPLLPRSKLTDVSTGKSEHSERSERNSNICTTSHIFRQCPYQQ